MAHHQNLMAVVFMGKSGSGKTTAVQYFTEKGIPKIATENSDNKLSIDQIIDQIHHLNDAGQHRIVIDDTGSTDDYHVLRHAFPGALTTIAISKDPGAFEGSNTADYSIVNDGSINDFHEKLDDVARELNFN